MHEPADKTPDANRFKTDDAASYDAVTAEFERYTERFSLPLAEHLVALATVPPAAQVLDVGCGTGVVCRLVARRHADSRVTAIDLSDGMLKAAADLCASDGVADRVQLRKEDAERLQLPDRSFDRIVSLFALRHFPNPDRALAEMLRVSRPGALTIVAVGSAPPVLSTSFLQAGVRRLGEGMLGLFGRAPLRATSFLDGLLDQYLGAVPPEQHAAWTHGRHGFQSSVGQLMRDVGYARVCTTWIGQSSEIESIEDFWSLQATFSSEARKRLPAATPAAAASLRAAFFDACTRHRARGGRMLYSTGALVAIGHAPG